MSIGVRRLSVVDVAAGHQPFANENCSVWAAQNGELFNHEELRRELAADGHSLSSQCDTEVIPHLYERYGEDFPTRLRGMFAIALWDQSRERAMLVRDRLGVKPLYYAISDDTVWFASELKVLLASGVVEPRLDQDALEAYFAFGFCPGTETLVAGVSKLSPGHRLIVENGGVRDEPYWKYPSAETDRSLDARTAPQMLLDQLEESVVLRLMSDVPLGVMLSGGLDSSLIAALMARNMREPLKTFSIGFTGSTNELGDAQLIAERLGADHHAIELDPSANVDLDALAWHLDEPVADLSSLGFFQLSKLAASEVTVALSGQGADELFGGYSRHRAMAAVRLWERLPAPELRRALLRLGPSQLQRLDAIASMSPADRYMTLKGVLPTAKLSELVRAPGGGVEALLLELLRTAGTDPLSQFLQVDARLGLVDDMLHYFDRMSMAHSLEVRVPFLDHKLVEFAARVPPSLKVRRLKTKWIVKQAARGLVPNVIIDKAKVGFFNASVEGWIERALRGSVRETLTDPGCRYDAYIDASAIRRLAFADPATRTRADRHLLLAVTMFEHWLANVFSSGSVELDEVRQRRVAGPHA